MSEFVIPMTWTDINRQQPRTESKRERERQKNVRTEAERKRERDTPRVTPPRTESERGRARQPITEPCVRTPEL